MSGMVEPVAGILGALAVSYATPVLPYALAFAAGAMVYVVRACLVPPRPHRQRTASLLSTSIRNRGIDFKKV